jgi:hypothetical protein
VAISSKAPKLLLKLLTNPETYKDVSGVLFRLSVACGSSRQGVWLPCSLEDPEPVRRRRNSCESCSLCRRGGALGRWPSLAVRDLEVVLLFA